MISIALDAASVARVRVAPSPIFDVVNWLVVAAKGRRHAVFGDPGARARHALRQQDVAAAAALLLSAERKFYVPDFLVPKPSQDPAEVCFEYQLEQVRHTPADVAWRQAIAGWSGDVGFLERLSKEGLAKVLANGLSTFWHEAMADDWSTMNEELAHQVRTSGELASSFGMAAVLNGTHPRIAWTGRHVTVEKRGDGAFRLDDSELVLVPSIFASVPITIQLDDPTDSYVAFRCGPPRERRQDGLSRSLLLGRGRSRVLSRVASAASTRQVARSVGLSESTVSYHLRALEGLGLVHGRRDGQSVVYALTTDGQQLLTTLQ